MKFAKTIQTIDSHTEGNPTRVIVGGVNPPPGQTLWERKEYLQEHDDDLRQLLNFEPRGGGLMCSVLLMDPMLPEADFSILIMEQEGYVPMCGHCAIGTATTVVAEKMVQVHEPVTEVVLHTLAGLVRAQVQVVDGEPVAVTITNVESFLLMQDKQLSVEGIGEITIDLGYGGDFYPIIDADALGIELTAANEPVIVSTACKIRESVQSQLSVIHPENPNINSCYQVQFISNKTETGSDIRNTVVAPPGAMDRSPCGTGTSLLTSRALMKGLIGINEEYRVEGPLGTFFCGRIIASELRDKIVYCTPQVSGRAFITGYNKFVLSDRDPFPAGCQVGLNAK